MNTFWVTGKNETTTLSRKLSIPDPPHHRTSPDKPYTISPSLPRAKLSLPSLTMFPKPDEWPQAQEQLQDFPIVDSVELGARARRNTVAVLPPYSSLVEETTLKEKHTHLPLSKVSSMPPNHRGQRLQGSEAEHSIFENCRHFGEDTLRPEMHLHESFSMPGSPYGAVQELEDFALHAEETARQARQQAIHAEASAQQARKMADWASDLVQRLQLTHLTDDEGSITGSINTDGLRMAIGDSVMADDQGITDRPRTSGEGTNCVRTSGAATCDVETTRAAKGTGEAITSRTTTVPAGGKAMSPGVKGIPENGVVNPPGDAGVKVCTKTVTDHIGILADNARTPMEGTETPRDGMGTPVDRVVTPTDSVGTSIDGAVWTHRRAIGNGTNTSMCRPDNVVANNSPSNQFCYMM